MFSEIVLFLVLVSITKETVEKSARMLNSQRKIVAKSSCLSISVSLTSGNFSINSSAECPVTLLANPKISEATNTA